MSAKYHAQSLASDEGTAYWFINSLVTIKATTEETGGALSLVHQVAPPGFATPYHSHPGEDETFYVLDGEATFFSNGDIFHLKSGAFIFLPRGTAHGFRVEGPTPVTMLVLSTPGNQFVGFVQEMGELTTQRVLPVPSPPDLPRLKRLSEKYGSVLLGSLPG